MRFRLPPFPSGQFPEIDAWARAVEDAITSLPRVSIISTANGPNVSGVTAEPGTLAIDIASSATTRVWHKRSSSTVTTGWSAFSWI